MLIFSSAEQLYLNHSYAAAVTALNQFNKISRKYKELQPIYLGECYLQLDKLQPAADAYLVVMQSPSGSYTELATKHYAAIQYRLEQYSNAVDAYMSLSDIAQINNGLEAFKGLMWSFYKNKQYRNALVQSEKVLDPSFDKAVRKEAVYVKPKATWHWVKGRKPAAVGRLSQESHTPFGAEAFFLLCKRLLIRAILIKQKR